MYILIGSFKFDITATYSGKDENGASASTYEVTGLSNVGNYLPYIYLNTYYMLYSFLGPQYAASYQNNLGTINITKLYDVEGKLVSDLATVTFLEGSNAFDLNGVLLTCENSEYTLEGNMFTIDMEGSDGYTYRLRFQLRMHQAFNMYGYQIAAITRVEHLTDGDIEVTTERVIVTDQQINPGAMYNMYVKKGETELTYSEAYLRDGAWYYIVRETDENGKITKTTYYKIELTEKEVGAVGDENENNNVVPEYESVKVTEIEVTTLYAENGTTWADIFEGKVSFINLDGKKYTVTESSYDEESKTYSITASSGKKYTITVNENGSITVKDVVEA